MNDDDLQNQIARLQERIEQLEQRVENLEQGSSRPATATTVPIASGIVNNDALVEAIRVALGQIGEGDAGAVRQQMVKNGQPNSLTRSDVNKTLYNRKDLFGVARQEGMKPIWKLLV